MGFETVRHDELTRLANAVSDAVAAARDHGMEIDECVSVVVTVAADYGRAAYGDDFLDALADLLLRRVNDPLPKIEREH